MGTSGSSGGPGSNTSLVPTWLDGDVGPLPGNDENTPSDDGEDGADETDGNPNAVPPQQPIRPPPEPNRFQSARRNFTSFARSGGSDSPALRRAVRDYVRSGTRGSGNAARKMGASRAAAGSLLGVLRGFQRDGAATTLRHLNLAGLVGRSVEDIFLGLTDVICRDGGSIDEGIARDAWLETLAELDSFGISDLDSLTEPQVREMFIAFIVNAIETRLFQEIGVNGMTVAADNAAIEAFQAQLGNYIERGVRDSFSSDLNGLDSMSDDDIMGIVDSTYGEAWELLQAWGDLEE